MEPSFSSTLSSSIVTGPWPSISALWHDFGHKTLRAVVTSVSSLSSHLRPSNFIGGAAGAYFFKQHQYQEHHGEALGWIIQTRFHFGNQLSRYVGVSVFINASRLNSFARASGLVFLVGVGSYIAYRVCLKIFGCRDLRSLLQYLCGKGSSAADECTTNGDGGKRCKLCKRRRTNNGSTSLNGRSAAERQQPDDDDDLPSSSSPKCRCGSGRNSGRSGKRRRYHQSGIYADECELDGQRPSSSSTSGGNISADECEDNPTELTDLASDCSGEIFSSVNHGGQQEKNTSDRVSSKPESSAAQRRRWRNSVGKRTNALDDPDGAYCCSDDDDAESQSGSSVTGFSKSRSPPPIPRSTKSTKVGAAGPMTQSLPVPVASGTSGKALSVKSMQSLPSSSQQYIWDPVCTPGDDAPLSDELLSYFADVPTGELVQRFLDGLPLLTDHHRASSPGPSEAASELSLAADRQLGDGTAEDFERLQFDLTELRTDVDEFDAELTTYLQERSDCLKSDNRLFYRSVIVEDAEEQEQDCGSTPSPSSSSSTPAKAATTGRKRRRSGAINTASTCHPAAESINKRQRDQSSTSSSNAENNNNNHNHDNDDDSRNKAPKRRRQSSSEAAAPPLEQNDTTQQQQREAGQTTPDRRPSTDDNHHNELDTSYSCNNNNEKSALSLDTGYVSSSCHTALWSSVQTGLGSPRGSSSADEDAVADGANDQKRAGTGGGNWNGRKRPTKLALPTTLPGITAVRLLGSDGNSICCDSAGSFPYYSSSGGELPTPSSRIDDLFACGNQRSPSAFSLEWDDDIAEQEHEEQEKYAGGNSAGHQFVAMALLEYLRLHNSGGDELKLTQFCQKLVARGYRCVMVLGEDHHHQISARATCSTRESSTDKLDNLVIASLSGMAYYHWTIFRCHSFQIIPEALDVSMKRCSFFTEQCSKYFGSTTVEGTRAYILQCMQKLWQLHESVQQNELSSNGRASSTSSSSSPSWTMLKDHGPELIDAVKVLMALRSLETYEEILFTRHTPRVFYADLFRQYTPSLYAQQKLFYPPEPATAAAAQAMPMDLEDLDIALLADTLGVRVEIFRPNSHHPESVAVYPGLEYDIANHARLPLLQPSTCDGIYLPLIR